jgi:hypothetical protein
VASHPRSRQPSAYIEKSSGTGACGRRDCAYRAEEFGNAASDGLGFLQKANGQRSIPSSRPFCLSEVFHDCSVYPPCTSVRRFCGFSPFCCFVEAITYVVSIPWRGFDSNPGGFPSAASASNVKVTVHPRPECDRTTAALWSLLVCRFWIVSEWATTSPQSSDPLRADEHRNPGCHIYELRVIRPTERRPFDINPQRVFASVPLTRH